MNLGQGSIAGNDLPAYHGAGAHSGVAFAARPQGLDSSGRCAPTPFACRRPHAKKPGILYMIREVIRFALALAIVYVAMTLAADPEGLGFMIQ